MMGPDLPEHVQSSAREGQEIDLREREIALREREVSAREAELKRRFSNPLVVAVIGATAALIGNAWVSWYNNHTQVQVERQRRQSELLAQVTRSPNPDEVCKNLVFLVRLELLDDANETIRKQCGAEPKGPVTLPLASSVASGLLSSNPTVTGEVVDARTGEPIAGVSISTESVSTQTDDGGHFTLTLPYVPLQISLSAKKDGYLPQTLSQFMYMGSPTIRLVKENQ